MMYPASLYALWKYGGMVAQAIKRRVDMCSEEVGDLRDWRHNLPGGRDCCVVPTLRLLRGQFATFTKNISELCIDERLQFHPRHGAQRCQTMACSAQYIRCGGANTHVRRHTSVREAQLGTSEARGRVQQQEVELEDSCTAAAANERPDRFHRLT
ncbi:hypothetical protein EDB83DRAFT_2417895 [Lactarius deliciosus]|nr:hypothetical protein EDB83DRAFT_2417895 [Lactarius deliciosus]